MRRLRSVLARLLGHFGRAHRERDWTAEFESHLQVHIEDNLRAGMSAEEDQASFAWLDTTSRDIRYALRGLGRSPGFTVTTLLSLALGLGASLAIFTVADNLLVRPLPYRDASRLVMVWEA